MQLKLELSPPSTNLIEQTPMFGFSSWKPSWSSPLTAKAHSPRIGTSNVTMVSEKAGTDAGCTAPGSTPAGVVMVSSAGSGSGFRTWAWNGRVPAGAGGSTSAQAGTKMDNATPRVTDRSTRPSSHTTRGPHPDDRAPDYSARCEAPALTAGQRSSGDALAGRGSTLTQALYFKVGQAPATRDSVPAPHRFMAEVGIPPPRLAGAMATLRIGQLAVDSAHVVVGLQWFTAPTA